MRLLAIFPYPTQELRLGVREGKEPDTYLMGLNHLGPDVSLDFLDPSLSRISEGLHTLFRLSPIRDPLRDRWFAANIVQQVQALPRLKGYDGLLVRDLKGLFLPALAQRIPPAKEMILLNAIVDGTGKFDFLLSPFLRRVPVIGYDARAMKEVFVQRLGIRESQLEYLPYGVDANFFTPRPPPREDGVIAVGETNRDYLTLIRALKALGVDCKIFASRVLSLPGMPGFDLMSIPPDIARVSRVDLRKLRDEYAKSAVVVIPLHETRTASGVTTLLEALAMEKATVVAATSGIKDYIETEKTVLTYRTGDARALATQLERLLQDEGLRRDLGREARRQVVEKFSTVVEGRTIRRLLDERLG